MGRWRCEFPIALGTDRSGRDPDLADGASGGRILHPGPAGAGAGLACLGLTTNTLLLLIHRGGPTTEHEWGEARRSAITLAESGNLLVLRNSAANWVADAKLLRDAGAAAYKAAESADAKTLESLADRIDASCTTCHKHFRPAVFALENLE